jgi:DnaK suppressor protein
LDQQRRFRTEQLEDLAVDAAEAMASSDQSRLQVTRVLTLAAEAALSEIDAALQRLEDGSYGICEHCVEPIPWQRLDVLPMSRLCTPCQYLAESGRSNSVGRGKSRSGSGIR